MMTKLKMLVVVALALLLLTPGLAQASLSFTQIDYPGATYTSANAINDSGQIVGWFIDADGNIHGYMLDKGKFTQYDVPVVGAAATFLQGINAKGEVGGTYVKDGRDWAFSLDKKGVVTTLNPPDAIKSDFGIPNAKGQIVGTYRTASPAPFTRHGFLWSKGVFTKIDAPGALDGSGHSAAGAGTTVFGISETGVILGSYQDPAPGGNQHFGFLLRKGVYTQLDPPSSYYDTAPQQINGAGQLVGWYTTSHTSTQHGFLLSTAPQKFGAS
jgi:probable HAF family extracellular repeat protein